jgi:hypothetical protein
MRRVRITKERLYSEDRNRGRALETMKERAAKKHRVK